MTRSAHHCHRLPGCHADCCLCFAFACSRVSLESVGDFANRIEAVRHSYAIRRTLHQGLHQPSTHALCLCLLSCLHGCRPEPRHHVYEVGRAKQASERQSTSTQLSRGEAEQASGRFAFTEPEPLIGLGFLWGLIAKLFVTPLLRYKARPSLLWLLHSHPASRRRRCRHRCKSADGVLNNITGLRRRG